MHPDILILSLFEERSQQGNLPPSISVKVTRAVKINVLRIILLKLALISNEENEVNRRRF